MSVLVRVVVVLGLLVLCGCTSTARQVPLQSANDDANYRYITLSNGLSVVIVSDAQTQKASASLDVYVGSGHDPSAFMGLAHFLEHMLFLGTEKYPEPGAYQAFISANGGSHNAFTAFEHTNYFFDVNADRLEEALDRFADFFVAPLFNEEYVEREKNAVESEYRARIKDEPRRIYDATKAIINPEHPFRQFSVGSLETLAAEVSLKNDQSKLFNVTLQDALRAFHGLYYVAPNMRLAVYGNQPLDELEAIVRSRFSFIANQADARWQALSSALNLREADQLLPSLFVEDQLPLQLTVEPEKAIQELRMTFPVEPVRAFYRQKPLAYIGHILGYEGEGSLLSALKQEGLADSLSAGAGFQYRGGATFTVSIALTEKGVTEVDNIIAGVFSAIDLIREEGVSESQFQEQKRLAEIAFQFLEQPSAMSRVIRLTSNLQYYPPEDVMYGDYRYDMFDAPLIHRYLDQLSPANVQVTLVAPQQLMDSEKEISPWFFTPFSVKKIGVNRLDQWKSNVLKSSLKLPALNPYVPENLHIVHAADQDIPVSLSLDKKDSMKLWFHHDNTFDVPKVDAYIAFKSKSIKRDAYEAAIARLYVKTIEEQLNETSYPAQLVDTRFSLYPHLRGMSLKVSGYNDSVPVLLSQVISSMKVPMITEQRFADIKQSQILEWENTIQATPYRRVSSRLGQLMFVGNWDDADLIKASKSVTLKEVQAFASRYFDDVAVDMLVHGNVDKEDTKTLANVVRDQLLTGNNEHSHDLLSVRRLPPGVQRYNSDSVHPDSAVSWYFQAQRDDLLSQAMTWLTADIIHPGFFDSLRTEQQLGYIVGAAYRPMHQWPGLSLQVQSPDASVERIVEAMQAYIDRFLQRYITDEQLFIQHRDALIQQLREPDQTLPDRSQRYWLNIAYAETNFDRSQRLATQMAEVSFADWQLFIIELFDKKKASLIVSATSKPAKGYDDISAGLSDAEAWPVVTYP